MTGQFSLAFLFLLSNPSRKEGLLSGLERGSLETLRWHGPPKIVYLRNLPGARSIPSRDPNTISRCHSFNFKMPQPGAWGACFGSGVCAAYGASFHAGQQALAALPAGSAESLAKRGLHGTRKNLSRGGALTFDAWAIFIQVVIIL